MSETAAILTTLIVYKLVLIAIGVYTSRRTRSAEDFFLGGRGLGPWVAALSASASSSSAWTLLGVSGYAYQRGLSALWIAPACVGGFALNWFLLAPRLRALSRETGALTVTDVLAGPRRSAGPRWVARVASAIVLLSLITYVAAQFQGAGKTFHEVFGLSAGSSVLLGAGVIVLYTLLGGFWAVSVTDTLQGVVMVAAALALPIAGLVLVGGIDGLGAAVAAVDAPGYASVTQGLGPAASVGLVIGLLGIGLGYPGQPHVVNRFMATRDEAAIRRGRVIAMTWATVTYLGMIVVGLCARALPQLAPVADKEVAFYGLVSEAFPPVIAGVMIAAVLSATMSTADSQLLVAASSVSHDLRAGEGQGRDAGALRRSRAVVVLLSVASVAVALYGNQEIFSHVLFAWTAMGAAFGPVLLVRVLVGALAPAWTLASMLSGFSLAVIAYSIPQTSGTAWERVAPVVVALVIALVGARRE